MGQERLSSLALMHIHDQVKIVLDEVINLFATKHPQRLELGIILRDSFRSILMYHLTLLKLLLYNFIQTVVFDKYITISHVLLLS